MGGAFHLGALQGRCAAGVKQLCWGHCVGLYDSSFPCACGHWTSQSAVWESCESKWSLGFQHPGWIGVKTTGQPVSGEGHRAVEWQVAHDTDLLDLHSSVSVRGTLENTLAFGRSLRVVCSEISDKIPWEPDGNLGEVCEYTTTSSTYPICPLVWGHLQWIQELLLWCLHFLAS